MDVDQSIELLGVLLLAALAGGTSAVLAALQRLSKTRVRFMASEGVPRSSALVAVAEQAGALEVTAAAANSAALVLAAAGVVLLIAGRLASNQSFAIAVGALALVLLLWVHLASRAMGSRRPEETLFLLQRPLWALHLLFRPFAALLGSTIRWTLLDREEMATSTAQLSDDDFRTDGRCGGGRGVPGRRRT